jgi:hypothetical protein
MSIYTDEVTLRGWTVLLNYRHSNVYAVSMSGYPENRYNQEDVRSVSLHTGMYQEEKKGDHEYESYV